MAEREMSDYAKNIKANLAKLESENGNNKFWLDAYKSEWVRHDDKISEMRDEKDKLLKRIADLEEELKLQDLKNKIREHEGR